MGNTALLQEFLDQSRREKKLVGVRRYGDNGDFTIGYVVDYNETAVSLQLISVHGRKDGVQVELLENIETLDSGDDYLKSYQVLMDNTDLIEEQTLEAVALPDGSNWQYHFLNTNHSPDKIMMLDLMNGGGFYGFIMDFDEHHVQVLGILRTGAEDGQSLIRLTDIKGFIADNLECRKRTAMFLLRTKI